MADYRQTYAAMRADGLSPDKASAQAVERMKSVWGVSDAAGNQLMRNPPENFYPSIDNSKAWIASDLKAWVANKIGPEFQSVKAKTDPLGLADHSYETGIGGLMPPRAWSIAGLIADGDTQRDIAAGRPPSYQVAVKRADGTLQIIDGRLKFDPTEHVASYMNRLEAYRQSIQLSRDVPLSLSQALR
jgi:hypothetical protein